MLEYDTGGGTIDPPTVPCVPYFHRFFLAPTHQPARLYLFESFIVDIHNQGCTHMPVKSSDGFVFSVFMCKRGRVRGNQACGPKSERKLPIWRALAKHETLRWMIHVTCNAQPHLCHGNKGAHLDVAASMSRLATWMAEGP